MQMAIKSKTPCRRRSSSSSLNTLSTSTVARRTALFLVCCLCWSFTHAERDFNFNDSQVPLLEPKDEPLSIRTSGYKQDPYAVELSRCHYADSEIMLSLVLKSHDWSDLSDNKKSKVLEKLSKFFAIPKEFIALETVTKRELNDMQKEAIRKGNNKCHSSRHLGRVDLMLGCGASYFTMGEPIANQIGAQMKDGSIDNITDEKFGWWVIWRKQDKTRAQRNRRQVEGSGEEDDYGDDYEYEYDDEENPETVTEPPAVTTHAHRHHHGDGKSELNENDVETEAEFELSNKSESQPKHSSASEAHESNVGSDLDADAGANNVLDANVNGVGADVDLVDEKIKSENEVEPQRPAANVDEEIVKGVSELESVIKKTIENTEHIKELPVVVVDEDDDSLSPVSEIEKELAASAGGVAGGGILDELTHVLDAKTDTTSALTSELQTTKSHGNFDERLTTSKTTIEDSQRLTSVGVNSLDTAEDVIIATTTTTSPSSSTANGVGFDRMNPVEAESESVLASKSDADADADAAFSATTTTISTLQTPTATTAASAATASHHENANANAMFTPSLSSALDSSFNTLPSSSSASSQSSPASSSASSSSSSYLLSSSASSSSSSSLYPTTTTTTTATNIITSAISNVSTTPSSPLLLLPSATTTTTTTSIITTATSTSRYKHKLVSSSIYDEANNIEHNENVDDNNANNHHNNNNDDSDDDDDNDDDDGDDDDIAELSTVSAQHDVLTLDEIIAKQHGNDYNTLSNTIAPISTLTTNLPLITTTTVTPPPPTTTTIILDIANLTQAFGQTTATATTTASTMTLTSPALMHVVSNGDDQTEFGNNNSNNHNGNNNDDDDDDDDEDEDDVGKKDDEAEGTTYVYEDNQQQHTTPQSIDAINTSSSSSTVQPELTSAAVDEVENTPPMIRTRLQKIAVTSGKSFTFIVPEDTFYDAEDNTNLRLLLTDQEGHQLKPTSWLQFNSETHELYGLPLDDAVSKWQYNLIATDSSNSSVTEKVEVSVQQHRGVRTVNHEINIAVKINEKHKPNIDWQLKLMRAIAETLGDSSTGSVVVREIRQTPQDANSATFVYFNETLPTSECPDAELSALVKRLDASRLSDLVHPTLSVKSITGQLIGSCQKSHNVKFNPTVQMTKNLPPMPRNQVDRVNATAGHLLVFKVPSDTFYDPNDSELTLTLKNKEHKDLSPRHWLQFDSKNQEFYGIPKSGDIGSEEYLLVAEDSGGLTATDALVVVVNHSPKKEFNVYFKAYLAIRHDQFNADLQRKFVERISQLFGDQAMNYVQIRSITTHHDSDSTIVNFYNTTLFKTHNRCPEDEIEAARGVYLMQDNTLRDSVKKTLGPELNLTSVQIITLASCHPQTDGPHREYPTTKTEEPTLKSAFADNYLYTVILPAAIIIVMILLASIIACCLHRRRHKSGKMELGDEEERKAFRNNGIPVIFQDELDEKPEMGKKSPTILKVEKPPLLPPSSNTTAMNGDNDVDEYKPPNPVVVGGREARGKSPATPSYRKPPPYVSP